MSLKPENKRPDEETSSERTEESAALEETQKTKKDAENSGKNRVSDTLRRQTGTKRFRIGGYSTAAILLVLAICIAVNVLMGALPATATQIDTTSNGIYSLSDETVQLLDGLQQEVTVYWITRETQQDEMLGHLLERYESRSEKLTVKRIDPELNPTFSQQYTSETVTENSLIVVSGDRSKYVDYSGFYSYDYSNAESTGSVGVNFEAENSITSAISYVTSSSLPKIYTLTGHGEESLSSAFTDAVTSRNMEVAELNLVSAGSVPEDASCILIDDPKSDISTEEKTALAAYMAGGGRIFLLTQPNNGEDWANLASLLSGYQVSKSDGIVVEGDDGHYAAYTNGPLFLLPHLESHEITEPLRQNNYYVLVPIAHAITVADELRDGLTVTPLLTTSDQAYSKAAGFGMTVLTKEEGDTDGPFTLGVAIEDVNENSRMVWIASAYLLDDDTNTQVSGGNEDLFLNALNWLCGETQTYAIHAKSLSSEKLTMSSSTASTWGLVLVFVLPLAILAVGIAIVVIRKKQ